MPRDSTDFWDQLMKHYHAKDYAAAYEIAQRGLKEFPEDRYHFRWASVCLCARKQDPELALQLFDEALQDGDWFGSEMLLKEIEDGGDLASLRGLPRLEDLVAHSLSMQDDARKDARPSLKVLEPTRPADEPLSLLMALYGNVANADSAAQIWGPATKHDWTVALPESSQMSAPNMFVWNDEAKAFRELAAHIDALSQEFELDPNRRVIAGFSRGGQVAMRMVMSGSIQVKAFLAVCPSIRNLPEWKPFIESAAELGVRGHVIAGAEDLDFVETTRAFAQECSSAGVQTEVDIRERLGHRFPTDFQEALPGLLEVLVRKRD